MDGCKLGSLAAGGDAMFLTNDITQDPLVHDQEWGPVAWIGIVRGSSAGIRRGGADRCAGVFQ